MKPVFQTTLVNCFPACIASILELSLEEVPDFNGKDWASRYIIWLGTKGWTLKFLARDKVPINYCIGFWRTWKGDMHSCVYLNGELVHDPSVRQVGEKDSPVLVWVSLRKQK